MELRKFALELAVRHLSKDAHNLETVFQWANYFYEWITQDGVRNIEHTVDPQATYGSKDMVSKAKLKEKLPSLGGQFKRNRFPSAAEIVGYKQAIDDVLRIIDEL